MIDTALPRPGNEGYMDEGTLEAEPGMLGKMKARVGQTVTTTKDTTVEYVQRNPYKALAVAALAGFVVGLILKRR